MNNDSAVVFRPWMFTLLFSLSPLLLYKGSPGFDFREMLFAVGFIMVICIWLAERLLMSSLPIRWKLPDVAILMLLGFILFDALKIVYTPMTFSEWLKWRKFFFLLIYFPISMQFTDDRRVRYLLFSIIGVGTVLALVDVFLVLMSGYSLTAGEAKKEISSTYPLWTVLLLLPMVKYFFDRKSNTPRYVRWGVLFSICICTISAVAFGRRTPLFLIVLAIVMSLSFSMARMKVSVWRPVLFVIISLCVFVVLLGKTASFMGAGYYSESSDDKNLFSRFSEVYSQRLRLERITTGLQGRLARAEKAVAIFQENPILGARRPVDFEFWDPRFGGRLRTGSLHSLYSYFLVRGGVIGFLALSFFIYKSLAFCISIIRGGRTSFSSAFGESAFIFLISFYICSLTSTRSLAPESWLFVGSICGIVAAVHRNRSRLEI